MTVAPLIKICIKWVFDYYQAITTVFIEFFKIICIYLLVFYFIKIKSDCASVVYWAIRKENDFEETNLLKFINISRLRNFF